MSKMEERAALWSGLISEQRSSGISQEAWCRERSLSFNTFCNWRTRLNKQKADTGGWASVSLDLAATPRNSITVRVGAATIDLTSGFDPQLLRDVVSALEPRC
jgi:hypothetical protein